MKTDSTSLKEDRILNSARNIISGLLGVIISTFFPFVIRTIMMYELGEVYLGLNGLYMSIMQILNLCELGLGNVMVFFFYKPIANEDNEKIGELLSYLRTCYRIIGITILALGFIITPFLGEFTSESIQMDMNVYLYFDIYLVAVAMQYFIFSEYIVLVNSYQRGDILNKVNIASNFFVYLLQLFALIIFKSYMLYMIALVAQSIIIGILRKRCIVSNIKKIDSHAKLPISERKEIKKTIVSMIGHQIDSQMLNSIDNIFVSSILGLTIVAIYGNYFYVITAITMVFATFYNSILAGIGNAVVVETSSSNYNRFMSFFWLNSCLTGCATMFLFCLFQNFMKVWMGNKLLNFDIIVLLCIYFYFSQMRQGVLVFKNANGLWWNDRFKPYVSFCIDIFLDIILINSIGIEGAIIASIVCIALIEIPWETKVLFSNYFNRSPADYISKFVYYSVVNIVVVILMSYVCNFLVPDDGYISLLMRFIICCVGSGLYFLIFHKNKEYTRWSTLLLKKIHRKKI